MTARPRNQSKSSFSRDAWLEIDLNAVEHNYKEIRKNLRSEQKLMAVVKSDAYGHGASVTGPLLEACGADYFGVASVDEGIQLREAGIKNNILILSPTPSWAMLRALNHNLEITLSSEEQLNELKKLIERNKKLTLPVKVQIKINTGMNRSGIKWNLGAVELINKVLAETEIFELAGVYSHLACGAQDIFSKVQIDRFRKVISEFDKEKLGILHVAATSLVAFGQQSEFDMVRIGLALYGIGQGKLELKPVLSLLARISQIQKVQADEAVGYNLSWQADQDSTIALLPLGYADGIKRGLSNRIKGLYKGAFISQVGTISMDQITFNVTDQDKEVKVGDLITLIGSHEDQSIEMREWAQILNTIEYEIACDLRARLPRVYVRK